MNTYGKATLLAGASALALGVATSQASAFEKVDWDWYTNIYEKVIIDIKIDTKFDPSGLVQVEKLQIFAGNLKSNAWVGAVIHEPAAPGYEVVRLENESWGTVDGEFSGHFSGTTHGVVYDEEIAYLKEGKKCVSYGWWGCKRYEEVEIPVYENDKDPFYGHTKGVVYGDFWGETHEYGYEDVIVYDPFTLDQLPLVEIAATSIANIETIDSDVAVMVNEGQFVFGDLNDHNGNDKRWWDNGGLDNWTYDDNSHVGLADALLEAMSDGNLTKANITANAGSFYIQQAQADIDATAIANVHSINVDAVTADDAIVIADITQFAYADVEANAFLGVHKVYGYNDLGKLDGALTSVVATAIGNVSNITVCAYNCDFSNGTE